MPDFKDRPESARHEQIFCGQYYDDMGCTGFPGDPSKDRISVLMLGLSDGVALAPIAASTRVASLLAVDLDETAFSRSLDNRNRLATNTDFDSVVADAAHFLNVTPDRYDVIIVDLYTQTGYAPIVFDHGFHQLLKSRLNPLGHVVFNGFGVPMWVIAQTCPPICIRPDQSFASDLTSTIRGHGRQRATQHRR